MNLQGNAEFNKQTVVEHPVRDPSTGFDYRTHIKDVKTGRIVRLQQYARHSHGSEVLLERPIGSGNAFRENGDPAGRWDFAAWRKLEDKHASFLEGPANREEELEQKNEILEAELAAMRAEMKAQAAAAPKSTKKD